MHNPYPYINEHCNREQAPIATAVRRFIETVNEFAGGWIGLSWCTHGNTPRTVWAQSHDSELLTTIATQAARHNVDDDYGIHLNICPRKGRPAGGRGEDHTVLNFPVLWVDVDGKDDSTLHALQAFRPTPNLIVASGGIGHYHAYWLLAYPAPYTPQVARINQGLAVAIGGDTANGKPSSMIRVPGTWNTKPDRRVLSTVVQWNTDKLHHLQAFEWLDAGPEIARPRAPRVETVQPERQVVTAEQVAMMCRNVKPYKDGWKVSCPNPSHGSGKGDNTPSMIVKPGDKGVVIHCFGGCDINQITKALGLPVGSLFSADSRPATGSELRQMWLQKTRSNRIK